MFAFVTSSSPLALGRSSFRCESSKQIARPSAHTTPTMALDSGISRRQFGLSLLSLSLVPAFPSLAKAATTEVPSKLAEAATKFRSGVAAVIKSDPTMAATLLRLSFHDAFTIDPATGKGGANGSVRFETGRAENYGLERGVKALEPIVQSSGLGWGDAVALAGAVAVRETGGPDIDIPLGRDTASGEDPQGALPAFNETVPELRLRFNPRGLTDRDMVALKGAHTLGRVGEANVFVKESNKFQNDYFKNLMWFQERREAGLSETEGPPEKPNFQLPSDLHLLDDPDTLVIVCEFANDQKAFFDAFSESYKRMVAIGTPFASLS